MDNFFGADGETLGAPFHSDTVDEQYPALLASGSEWRRSWKDAEREGFPEP